MPKEGNIVAGKYLLEKSLGTGGMGEVFQAVHQDIGKRVALKFLQAKHSEMPKTVARFQREAKMASAAGHRGIVDIFDIGVDDEGLPYFVMELLEGQALQDLLYPCRQLDISTAAYIGCQVLSALSAAHGAGIVHRDLKPANIFLVDTGALLPEVKLLDFGICRLVGSGMPEEDQSMTQTGTVLGTPTYMSPEQAMGDKDNIDHRTDVYAMGVILFECVTGNLPFTAPNYNSLIVTIITSNPANPKDLRPDLPDELERIILRSLEKDQGDRYQSSSEMFQDLLEYVDEASLSRIILPSGCTLPGASRLLLAESRPPSETTPSEPDSVPLPPKKTTPSGEPVVEAEPSADIPPRGPSPIIWAGGGALGALLIVGAGLFLWGGGSGSEAQVPPNTEPVITTEVDAGGAGDASIAPPPEVTDTIDGGHDGEVGTPEPDATAEGDATPTVTDEPSMESTGDDSTTSPTIHSDRPPRRRDHDSPRTPREPETPPEPPPQEPGTGVYVD